MTTFGGNFQSVLLALLSTPMAVHGGTDAGPARARVRDGVVDADLEIVGDVSFLASPIVNYTIVADGTASQGCEAEVRIFVNEATTDGWNAELSLHPSVAVSTLVGAALDANLDGSDGMLKVYSQDATESVPASTTLEINVFFGGDCPRIFAATFGGTLAPPPFPIFRFDFISFVILKGVLISLTFIVATIALFVSICWLTLPFSFSSTHPPSVCRGRRDCDGGYHRPANRSTDLEELHRGVAVWVLPDCRRHRRRQV